MRTGRRAQIVEAAIDTIATEGLGGTSFARIARTAGLSSTGLISYHFAGKRELMDEVVRVVTGELADAVAERMREADGPAEGLRAYLAATIEFAGKHHVRLRAAREIAPAGPDAGADGLEALLRTGQLAGEFRFFDVGVMALAVRAVRDGLLDRLAADPDLDLATCTDELVTTFELATRG
ncbi:MAG TPA: TetR family transcriptional regulator [Actinophytocola sp.]|jgi:AcrR family transcriptional regulator|nr:TetR family transcriptional regulator [Actinophytocola sp.]